MNASRIPCVQHVHRRLRQKALESLKKSTFLDQTVDDSFLQIFRPLCDSMVQVLSSSNNYNLVALSSMKTLRGLLISSASLSVHKSEPEPGVVSPTLE